MPGAELLLQTPFHIGHHFLTFSSPSKKLILPLRHCVSFSEIRLALQAELPEFLPNHKSSLPMRNIPELRTPCGVNLCCQEGMKALAWLQKSDPEEMKFEHTQGSHINSGFFITALARQIWDKDSLASLLNNTDITKCTCFILSSFGISTAFGYVRVRSILW